MAIALLAVALPAYAAAAITTPMGPWIDGIATNHGSAYDKPEPYQGSSEHHMC